MESPLGWERQNSVRARAVHGQGWIVPLEYSASFGWGDKLSALRVLLPLARAHFCLLVHWQTLTHLLGLGSGSHDYHHPTRPAPFFVSFPSSPLSPHRVVLPGLLLPPSAPCEQNRGSLPSQFPQGLAWHLPYGWCSLKERRPDSQACVSQVLSLTWNERTCALSAHQWETEHVKHWEGLCYEPEPTLGDFYFWKHTKALGRVQEMAAGVKNEVEEPGRGVGILCPDTDTVFTALSAQHEGSHPTCTHHFRRWLRGDRVVTKNGGVYTNLHKSKLKSRLGHFPSLMPGPQRMFLPFSTQDWGEKKT